jgi:hypothetical protein
LGPNRIHHIAPVRRHEDAHAIRHDGRGTRTRDRPRLSGEQTHPKAVAGRQPSKRRKAVLQVLTEACCAPLGLSPCLNRTQGTGDRVLQGHVLELTGVGHDRSLAPNRGLVPVAGCCGRAGHRGATRGWAASTSGHRCHRKQAGEHQQRDAVTADDPECLLSQPWCFAPQRLHRGSKVTVGVAACPVAVPVGVRGSWFVCPHRDGPGQVVTMKTG